LDPNSLLNSVRKLIQIKKAEPALAAYAEFVPVYAKENDYPFIFARANGKDVILAVFNPAPMEKTAEFSLNLDIQDFKLIAGTKSLIEINRNKYKLKISGETYSIYKLSYK
jgi:glycosidase